MLGDRALFRQEAEIAVGSATAVQMPATAFPERFVPESLA